MTAYKEYYFLSADGQQIAHGIAEYGKRYEDFAEFHYGNSFTVAANDHLAIGSYNRKFAPNRTDADWISTSEANMNAYLRDLQCGGKISAGLMHDLLEGMWLINRNKNPGVKQPCLYGE